MTPLPRFRDPRLSLWQSSVAKVLARPSMSRAGTAFDDQDMMRAASFAAIPFEGRAPGVASVSKISSLPTSGTVDRCAWLYLQKIYATDPAEQAAIDEQIAQFGACDPRWAEAFAEFELHQKLLRQPIPYIAPTGPNDAVINGLPDRATIGFLSDWGTGTSDANALLGELAAMRSPGVPFFLIHLGDIYYSGTADEVQRFVDNCREIVGPDVPVFTLSGNHDMYAGGAPYYQAIGTLNSAPFLQKTSYFNLRNNCWQIQAMDTGLNDRDPSMVDFDSTFLDPAEATWHQQQFASAGSRKVVLLSHHQPFSAFVNVGDGFVNDRLLSDLGGNFSQVALWLWGHEHNMIFYDSYAGISRGRCIGSGAVPVTVAEDPYGVEDSAIGFNRTAILDNDGRVYSHSFAIMEIDGPRGAIKYYQSPDPRGRNPIFVEEIGS